MNAEQLIAIYRCAPHLAERFAEPLTAAMQRFEINTAQRASAFLSQVGHESGRLKFVREIWSPDRYEWQARYEGRRDLGNTEPGDGERFLGRGLIQLTGRANYTACAAGLGLPLKEQPELLEQPAHAAMSAAWFWDSRKLNFLADFDEFEKITRRINGGLNGYDDRLALWARAKHVLEDS